MSDLVRTKIQYDLTVLREIGKLPICHVRPEGLPSCCATPLERALKDEKEGDKELILSPPRKAFPSTQENKDFNKNDVFQGGKPRWDHVAGKPNNSLAANKDRRFHDNPQGHAHNNHPGPHDGPRYDRHPAWASDRDELRTFGTGDPRRDKELEKQGKGDHTNRNWSDRWGERSVAPSRKEDRRDEKATAHDGPDMSPPCLPFGTDASQGMPSDAAEAGKGSNGRRMPGDTSEVDAWFGKVDPLGDDGEAAKAAFDIEVDLVGGLTPDFAPVEGEEEDVVPKPLQKRLLAEAAGASGPASRFSTWFSLTEESQHGASRRVQNMHEEVRGEGTNTTLHIDQGLPNSTSAPQRGLTQPALSQIHNNAFQPNPPAALPTPVSVHVTPAAQQPIPSSAPSSNTLPVQPSASLVAPRQSPASGTVPTSHFVPPITASPQPPIPTPQPAPAAKPSTSPNLGPAMAGPSVPPPGVSPKLMPADPMSQMSMGRMAAADFGHQGWNGQPNAMPPMHHQHMLTLHHHAHHHQHMAAFQHLQHSMAQFAAAQQGPPRPMQPPQMHAHGHHHLQQQQQHQLPLSQPAPPPHLQAPHGLPPAFEQMRVAPHMHQMVAGKGAQPMGPLPPNNVAFMLQQKAMQAQAQGPPTMQHSNLNAGFMAPGMGPKSGLMPQNPGAGGPVSNQPSPFLQQLAQLSPQAQQQPMPQPTMAIKVPPGGNKDGGFDVTNLLQFLSSGRMQQANIEPTPMGPKMLSAEEFEKQFSGQQPRR